MARALALASLLFLAVSFLHAEPVTVREAEGLLHGFLSLSTLDGKDLADGDLFQTADGNRITSRLVFRFRDGSSSEETTVFTQNKSFRLITYRLIQKGPAFPRPLLDAAIDVGSGRVKVRYDNEDGKEKSIDERMDLPQDLANGLITTILKNLSPQSPKTVVPMLGFMPKPRLVTLELVPSGKESFRTGGMGRTATRYLVKVDIGGIMGALASLLGKTPPDSSVWILGGEAPAFVKSESPHFAGGPLWRVELVSPVWPETSAARPAEDDKKD